MNVFSFQFSNRLEPPTTADSVHVNYVHPANISKKQVLLSWFKWYFTYWQEKRSDNASSPHLLLPKYSFYLFALPWHYLYRPNGGGGAWHSNLSCWPSAHTAYSMAQPILLQKVELNHWFTAFLEKLIRCNYPVTQNILRMSWGPKVHNRPPWA